MPLTDTNYQVVYATDTIYAGWQKYNLTLTALDGVTGAGLIGIENLGTHYSGDTVEAALDEIGNNINSIEANIITIEGNITTIEADIDIIQEQINLDTAFYRPITSVNSAITPFSNTTLALPSNNGTLKIYAAVDCFIKFDTNLENPIYMPAGTELFGISTEEFITIRGVSSAGFINITGLDSSYKYTITSSISIPYGGGTSSATLPSGSTSYRLFSTTDCFVGFNGQADMFFPAGTEIISTTGTSVYVQRYSLDGVLYITGLS